MKTKKQRPRKQIKRSQIVRTALKHIKMHNDDCCDCGKTREEIAESAGLVIRYPYLFPRV